METIVRRSFYLAAIGLLAASGCFAGSYEESYRKSVVRYRQESEFQGLHKESRTLTGGRLRLRVPKLFDDEDSDGTKEWSKPPILEDLGRNRIGYRCPKALKNENVRATLTVYAVTDDEISFDGIKTLILEAVRKEPAFAAVDWQQVETQTDDDGKPAWSMMKLEGQQPFDREVANNPEEKSSEGETQIWVSSSPESKVSAVLVWRIPQELAAEVLLHELAPLVARKVELLPEPKPAPAAAAPDPAQEAAPAAK